MFTKPILQLPRSKKLHQIGLRCLACQQGFTWHARQLFLDIGTAHRKAKGEKTPFGAYVIAAHVICPHCGVEDRYALSGWQYFIMTLTMLWMGWFPPGPESWFKAIEMSSRDGQVMHPFELRLSCEEQVNAQPRKADLRLDYANTLRTIGWLNEAIEQYRQTLALAPQEPEALINLAALLAQRGEQNEALNYVSALANIKPKNKKQREYVGIARSVLTDELSLDELEVGNPLVLRRR